ncbi:MAG: hypothetical protein GY822_02360 [Deltaproteobacteria bacterium]|nr:hypothetical protein [Deltaproteobacteria bacterium]
MVTAEAKRYVNKGKRRLLKVRSILKRLRDLFSVKIHFDDLKKKEAIFLYAGDVPQNDFYNKFIGLSLSQANSQHIKHDVMKPLSLEDFTVDIYRYLPV